MTGQEFLTELVSQLKQQTAQQRADDELDRVRGRLRKAIDRLFANEIAQIEILIGDPNRYSVKGLENLVIEAKWNLSRLTDVVERIEQLRPLIRIEDATTVGNVSAKLGERKMVILENDRKVRSTYHEHAQSDPELELGGRFVKLTPTSVTGSGPSPIPKQPSHSPWHHDPIGDEPPLGYSVEDHDAVGERHERAGSAVPVEPTNRMDTAGTAAAPALSHVVTGAVAVKSRRRM